MVRFSSGVIARRGDVRQGGVASRPAWSSRGRFLHFGGTLMSELYSMSDSTNSDNFPALAARMGSVAAVSGLAARPRPARFHPLVCSISAAEAGCPSGRILCLPIMCRLWFVDCKLCLPHTPQTYGYIARGGRSSPSVLSTDCLVRTMAKPSVDRGFVSVEPG